MAGRFEQAHEKFEEVLTHIPDNARFRPSHTLVPNIATQAATTKSSISKLTGIPVNLEMSAAIMGVENPNELPMPPTKAIMKKLSMRRAPMDDSPPLMKCGAEILYLSLDTPRT